MTDTTSTITFIEAIIESQHALSALWLATKLNTSLSVAQNSMDAYVRLNTKVDKKMIVSGFCNDTGILNFSLQNENDLHSIQLQDIIVHMHSIGKYGIRNIDQIVQNSDDKLLYDCLNSDTGLPFLNSVGGIKLRNLEVRHVGERVFNNPVPDLVAVQGEAAKHIDAVFVSKPIATAVRKAKSSIDVTNFFSKADSLKQPEEVVSPPEMDVAEKEKERQHSDDGDEAEWEDEEEKPAKKGKPGADRPATKPSVTKPSRPRPNTKEQQSKSKREHVQGPQEEKAGPAPEHGGGNAGLPQPLEQEQGEEREQEVSRSPAPAQQRRKRKEVLHGAMDDFMAEKEPPQGDGAPIAAPSDRPPRGKRRRLVEKMFADSKGYLVTEMVWELSDGDDGDEAGLEAEVEVEVGVEAAEVKQALTSKEEKEDGTIPAASASASASSSAAPPTKDGKEKKAAGPAKKAPKGQAGKGSGGGTQKSMTSFFGAKP